MYPILALDKCHFITVYGSRKITRIINRNSDSPVNHKRIERIMSENKIYSKTKRKYRATTNPNHKLPVSKNLLNREFTSNTPKMKLVSDITYIPTDEDSLKILREYFYFSFFF